MLKTDAWQGDVLFDFAIRSLSRRLDDMVFLFPLYGRKRKKCLVQNLSLLYGSATSA
jgi:hypothetical protein